MSYKLRKKNMEGGEGGYNLSRILLQCIVSLCVSIAYTQVYKNSAHVIQHRKIYKYRCAFDCSRLLKILK